MRLRKSIRLSIVSGLQLCALVLSVSTPAAADTISFTSKADFVGQTGGTLNTLPERDTPYTVTTNEGDLLVSAAEASGANGIISGPQLAPLSFTLRTNFVAKSANEDWDITALTPIYAFGFSLYEPTAAGQLNGCNFTCTESTFVITLLSGGTTLTTLTVEPADNVFNFYGFWSSDQITSIQIRETVGTPDNEYFGEFYAGKTAMQGNRSSVPEPASLMLVAIGLAGIGFVERFKLIESNR